MITANKLLGISVAVFIAVGFLFFAKQARADDFRPACINDPKGHDFRLTLQRYSTNERAFLIKRLKFEHIQKLISIWQSDPDYVLLPIDEWNMMQVIITPHFSFAVRGKKVSDYVPICFTKRLTEKQMIDLFGKTSKQMFKKSTDL